MNESRVASRYAKSVLDLAREKGVLEEVHEDMLMFYNLCHENPALARTFKSPVIPHSKKQTILNLLLKGRVHDLTLSFFEIIGKKNREAYNYFIAKEFLQQYRQYKGIESAEVVTAFALTDGQRASFIKLVAGASGKEVALKETIDEDIIGGFILNIGDRQIDESVKSKIQKLKTKFKENPYISKL